MGEPSNYGRGADEEEDEEEDIGEAGYKTVKDAVLFAIDVSKSMLTSPSSRTQRSPTLDCVLLSLR